MREEWVNFWSISIDIFTWFSSNRDGRCSNAAEEMHAHCTSSSKGILVLVLRLLLLWAQMPRIFGPGMRQFRLNKFLWAYSKLDSKAGDRNEPNQPSIHSVLDDESEHTVRHSLHNYIKQPVPKMVGELKWINWIDDLWKNNWTVLEAIESTDLLNRNKHRKSSTEELGWLFKYFYLGKGTFSKLQEREGEIVKLVLWWFTQFRTRPRGTISVH